MKTVQINCILEFSFEEDLTREELIKKAADTLMNASYKELGEMIQIADADGWRVMNESGEEVSMEK